MGQVKSFYDLDYIIEISEKRVEQFASACQLILGRISNIILVYTIIGIYLVPIVQDFHTSNSWIFKAVVILMLSLISLSVMFTIGLLWPSHISYLEISKHYYQDLRLEYENRFMNKDLKIGQIETTKGIDFLLKTSYIDELNRAQEYNKKTFGIKYNCYYLALALALTAIPPYMICVLNHINKKEINVQKFSNIKSQHPVNCIKTFSYVQAFPEKETIDQRRRR